jgi:hypothetical protein
MLIIEDPVEYPMPIFHQQPARALARRMEKVRPLKARRTFLTLHAMMSERSRMHAKAAAIAERRGAQARWEAVMSTAFRMPDTGRLVLTTMHAPAPGVQT